jgi:hypothetical protein
MPASNRLATSAPKTVHFRFIIVPPTANLQQQPLPGFAETVMPVCS